MAPLCRRATGSTGEATVAADVGGGSCAQVVPHLGAFLIIPAHSSARGRRESSVPHQTVARTYTTRGIGLKILVSAVQSRPCPPFFSAGCPLRNSPSIEFVPRFVPNSGTLQRIRGHFESVTTGRLGWERGGILTMAGE